MDLRDLQRHWDTFGARDPFWAILTDPARRGNRWSPDEFFATGVEEVGQLLAQAETLGVPRRWQAALDFGCGAGRLTQALADRFETAVGIDVAPSMIALARSHNRHGDRCHYEVNDRSDLARWPDGTFDLIYTSRVLQHIAPRYATGYVREFVRLLAPGGLLSFDVPSASGDAAAMADGTVPASAMRGLVVVASTGPVVADAGARVVITVQVTNLSAETWRDAPGHPINVGNHWLDDGGAMVQQDDGRVKLPTPLAPGAMATVDLTTQAPRTPGVHRLQVDVVQEGVAWFADCGSTPGEVVVHVGEAGRGMSPAVVAGAGTRPATGPDADESFEPVMEMHAVPREEIESIVREAGATLLAVRRVHHCGPLWLAYRYDVTT